MSYSTIDKEAQPIVSEAPSYYSKKFLAGAVAIAFVMGAAAATATASVPAVSTSTYFDRADVFSDESRRRRGRDVDDLIPTAERNSERRRPS